MAKRVKRTPFKKIIKEQKLQREKPVSYDSGGLIARLPDRTLEQIVGMRTNAFAVLANEEKKAYHLEAKRLLGAISGEFIRRFGGKIEENGFFNWPNTNIGYNNETSLTDTGWIEEGVLSHFGYRVGTTDGKHEKLRHIILHEVFEGVIPPIFEMSYLREWGAPSSSKRLQKMAETIASLTRNAKRRGDQKLESAIKEWEGDLEFLYWNFYIDHFRFVWPATTTQ